MKRTWQTFTAVFKDGGKICWPLVAVFLIINAIVCTNAIFHDPDTQYDSGGHLANIRAISAGHLPAKDESVEYFSAPLAYFLPALILRLSSLPILKIAKIAQLINILLSLALSFTLLKISDELFPARVSARLISLGSLGLLPVYYRTFAYPRGEPYVAVLTLLAAWQAIRLFGRQTGSWSGAILLGLTLGLDILARQWAFFFFPALYIFGALCAWAAHSRPKQILAQLLVVSLVAALVGGWFYLSLYQRFGTVTAFNRAPGDQFLGNQEASFYTGTGNGYLFTKPVRPLMSNQLLPILYADSWGDYWGYFLIEGVDSHTGRFVEGIFFENAILSPSHGGLITNYDTFGAYLGQVNLVAVLPSLIFLTGLLYGIWEVLLCLRPTAGPRPIEASTLLTLALVFTLGGYFWFLVTYPSAAGGGTTIKATYVLQVFPLFGLLAANLFEKVALLRSKQKWLWGLVLVFLFNLPALITHFYVWPWK